MVPSFASANAAKQNISSAEHICCGGFMSMTSNFAFLTSCLLLRVLRMFCFRRFMCPLSVAVEGGRCLLMSSYVSPGNVLNGGMVGFGGERTRH